MITIECNKLFLAHGTSIHKLRYPIDATPFPPSLLYIENAGHRSRRRRCPRSNHRSPCEVSISRNGSRQFQNANRKTRRITTWKTCVPSRVRTNAIFCLDLGLFALFSSLSPVFRSDSDRVVLIDGVVSEGTLGNRARR